ncbi:hypothetical protein FRB94_000136 [Tulasnella sp. JGI-2019a]|nr:hypothetical protein FRB94_000136 [Tulasnella sp. JGI-2019a]KAG9015820.1 hypothetical protein FRB93_012385 [Tulasnella sp. JGI-2019a]KAG9039548.1 hypothetical protein FRB95_009128 [Tulasnella sp. JGI-2019a]
MQNQEIESDNDSLFGGSTTSEMGSGPPPSAPIALRSIPSGYAISGLHFNPDIRLPETMALTLLRNIKEFNYFRGGQVNQLMLFERGRTAVLETTRGVIPPNSVQESSVDAAPSCLEDDPPVASSSLPSFLLNLISCLSELLRDQIPHSTHELLFPPPDSSALKPARQAILNLYRPGEGITAHVDLLKRFGDGIIIVSLGSGTVMELAPVPSSDIIALPSLEAGQSPQSQMSEGVSLWLEPRSILVLEGEARYNWTHGIPARDGDWVQDEEDMDGAVDAQWIPRDVRVSITLRWLLPGAEVVGGAMGDDQTV